MVSKLFSANIRHSFIQGNIWRSVLKFDMFISRKRRAHIALAHCKLTKTRSKLFDVMKLSGYLQFGDIRFPIMRRFRDFKMTFPTTSNVHTTRTTSVQYGGIKLVEQSVVTLQNVKEGPWQEDGKALKPCWNISGSRKEDEKSKGFITFSLDNSPEFHVSQVADAVVVAKHLGATLVLPDISGSKTKHKWNFEEIYDAEKFIKSLDGVINVVKKHPALQNLAVVRVPNRVSKDYITSHIEPIFRTLGNLRLVTYFPAINLKKAQKTNYLDKTACLAMFETLQLQPKVQKLVNSMVKRLRALSQKTNGQFIAVDLRLDMLKNKGCQGSGDADIKSCYDAEEIGQFLKKIGFERDATVYLTQPEWHSSIDALRNSFPNTYTKDLIMPADRKVRFLGSQDSEFDKVIDFYVCSESDVFVPAISGVFYANVAGKRIASSKTQILVPSQNRTVSASASNYISSYVSNKNHFAYSCFC